MTIADPLGVDPSSSELHADGVPAGWVLGRASWSFHRQFFERCGRPAERLEYSDILWQIRRGAERVERDLYRVRLADGRTVTVRGGRKLLLGVLPLDAQAFDAQAPWQPPDARPPSNPVPDPVPRGSTLTLGGNKTAAKALAERLRRFGIPNPAVVASANSSRSNTVQPK